MARQKRDPTAISPGLGSAFGEFFRGQGDDDSYVEQLGRGLTKVPGKAQEFLSQDIGDIAEDVSDFGVAFGQEVAKQAKENPLKFIAETFTPYGYVVSARETRDLLEQADALRAQGQVEQAEGLEALSTVALLDLIPGGRLFRKAGNRIEIANDISNQDRNNFPIPDRGVSFKPAKQPFIPKGKIGIDQLESGIINKQPKELKEAARKAGIASIVTGKKGQKQIDSELFRENIKSFDTTGDLVVTSKPINRGTSEHPNIGGEDPEGTNLNGNAGVVTFFKRRPGGAAAVENFGPRRSVIQNLIGPNLSQYINSVRGTTAEAHEYDANFDSPDASIDELVETELERLKTTNFGLSEQYENVVSKLLNDDLFKKELKNAIGTRRFKDFNKQIASIRTAATTPGVLVPAGITDNVNRRIVESFEITNPDRGDAETLARGNPSPHVNITLFSRLGMSPDDMGRLMAYAEQEGLDTVSKSLTDQMNFVRVALEQVERNQNLPLDQQDPFSSLEVYNELRDTSRDLIPEYTTSDLVELVDKAKEKFKKQKLEVKDIFLPFARYANNFVFDKNLTSSLRQETTSPVTPIRALLGSDDLFEGRGGGFSFGRIGKMELRDDYRPGVISAGSNQRLFYNENFDDDINLAVDDSVDDIKGLEDTDRHSGEFLRPLDPYVAKHQGGFSRVTDNFVLTNTGGRFFTEDDIGKDLEFEQSLLPRDYIVNSSGRIDTTYTGDVGPAGSVLKARHSLEYQPDPRGQANYGSQLEKDQAEALKTAGTPVRFPATTLNQKVENLKALETIAENKDVLINNQNPTIKNMKNRLHVEILPKAYRAVTFGKRGTKEKATNISTFQDVNPPVNVGLDRSLRPNQLVTRRSDVENLGGELFDGPTDLYKEISGGNINSQYTRDIKTLSKGLAKFTKELKKPVEELTETEVNNLHKQYFDDLELFNAFERANKHVANTVLLLPQRQADGSPSLSAVEMKKLLNESAVKYFMDERILQRGPNQVQRDLLGDTTPEIIQRAEAEDLLLSKNASQADNLEEGLKLGVEQRQTRDETVQEFARLREPTSTTAPKLFGYLDVDLDERLMPDTRRPLIFKRYSQYLGLDSGVNEIFPGYLYEANVTQQKQIKGAVLDAIRNTDSQAISSPGVVRIQLPDFNPNLPADEVLNPQYKYMSSEGQFNDPRLSAKASGTTEQFKPQVYKDMHRNHVSVVKDLNADLPWAEKGEVPEGKPRFYADILPTGNIPDRVLATPDKNETIMLRIRPVIRWDKEAGDYFKTEPLPFRDGGLVSLPKMAPGLEPLLRKYRREGTLSHFI